MAQVSRLGVENSATIGTTLVQLTGDIPFADYLDILDAADTVYVSTSASAADGDAVPAARMEIAITSLPVLGLPIGHASKVLIAQASSGTLNWRIR